MSSTNRGRERNRHDDYPTPAWCVDRFCEEVVLPVGQWLEPCAGDGAIIRAFNDNYNADAIAWDAIEIREGPIPELEAIHNVSAVQGNALEILSDPNISYVVSASNPPFELAQEFIEVCRARSTHTVLLLRLNYLASEKRHAYMTATRPDVYVLPNRPSFVGGGKTDSIEYAWFHWHPGADGKLRILGLTPKEERIIRPRRRKTHGR